MAWVAFALGVIERYGLHREHRFDAVYRPMTRLTTMAAMPASTALAIGDDRMSVNRT